MSRRLAALGLLVAACDGPPGAAAPATAAPSAAAAPWPSFPGDAGAADTVLGTTSARWDEPAFDLARLREAIVAANAGGTLRVGWAAIARAIATEVAAQASLGRRTFVLVGNQHDAPLQLDAFRELAARLGAMQVLEQFAATGRWEGVAASLQQGDEALLAAVTSGDGRAIATFREEHGRDDYTAWKYGYVSKVLDVLLVARAQGLRVVGCDMPRALEERTHGFGLMQSSRLRELHCGLALQDLLRDDAELARPVALFWGDAHLGPTGLATRLPPDAHVLAVHLLGGRAGSVRVETELRTEVVDPVLVPLVASDTRRFVLLLPAGSLAARVDRVLAASESSPRLRVSAAAGALRVGQARHALGAAPVEVPLAGGHATWLLELADRTVVMGLEAPSAGAVVVDVEPDGTVRFEQPP
jgi:hypothetical protein